MKPAVLNPLDQRDPSAEASEVELSILMPCLNEAETLEGCIRAAQQFLLDHGLVGEVVVADNGSVDGSPEIARRAGSRVVPVHLKGYGSALATGIAACRGRWIIMGDADGSYDFARLSQFVERLRQGYELVMGNRFQGGIEPGAMPILNRYLGNPLLTRLGRLLFGANVGDIYCGLRGFTKTAAQRMRLQSVGMEFAPEMVVKATLLGIKVTEVPTRLRPDGRGRPPHLRPWRDGWRTLRVLLIYSPKWLFLYPGIFLIAAGFALGVWLWPQPRTLGTITYDIHTLLYAGVAILIGFQALSFAIFTKVFAISEGLLPMDSRFNNLLRVITLEIGLLVGGVLIVIGLGSSLYAVKSWSERAFGPLDASHMLRVVVPSVVSLLLGCQIILSSCFLTVLGFRGQRG